MWKLGLCIVLLFQAANGLRCYDCSSDTLETCATLKLKKDTELPTKLCDDDDTACYTKVENGKTIRGCFSEYDTPETMPSSEDLEKCYLDKCNGQIYPEDRLFCLHCDGNDCVNQTDLIEVKHPCANYIYRDECYNVFSYDGKLAYRGCMSDSPQSSGRKFCTQHNEQCHKCSTRGCNSGIATWEKQMSCVKCTSENNENCATKADQIAPTVCALTIIGYKNQCYTRLNNELLERGCLYEATEDVRNECQNTEKNSCKTCNETGCNTAIAHIDEYCYTCDSNNDANCKDKLNSEMERKCGFSHKGCYLIRKNSKLSDTYMYMFRRYEQVRRGCLSDLNEVDLNKCLSNDSRDCKTCQGKNCNKIIKPLDCVRCNSETNPICAEKPISIKPLECDQYDDKCMTIMHRNKTIVRDCLKNSAIDEEFCDENPWLCQTCESDNCNTMLTVDNTCYVCDSTKNSNCSIKVDDEMIQNCPFSAENPGCYHFINKTDSSVKRGCLEHLKNDELQLCKENGDECKTCQQDKCNSKKSFHQCSNGSIDLEQKSRGFGTKICHDYTDQCYIRLENNTVTRGCLQEYIAINNQTKEHQNQLGVAMYRTCATPMCNEDEIDTEHCISCSSDTDPDCIDKVTSKKRKKCNLAKELMGCYHYEDLEANDGKLVIRGCVTEIEENKSKMKSSHADLLKYCKGNECNSRPTFQRCRETGPNEKEQDYRVVVCQEYSNECYTHISDNIIRRGCLNDTNALITDGVDIQNDCQDEDICEKCSDNLCNNKTIEKEFCFVCDSKNNMLCGIEPDPTMRVQCPLAVKPLGCFLYKNLSEPVRRGCLRSEPPSQRKLCREQGDTCKTCMGVGCNKKVSFEECHSCDSGTDEDCALNGWKTKKKICKNYYDECFTLATPYVTIRACISDNEKYDLEKCIENPNCLNCSGEAGCNEHNMTYHKPERCIQCDSKVDSTCRTNTTFDSSVVCPLVTVKKRGCYHFIDKNTGDTRRGCMCDLSYNEEKLHLENGDEHKVCYRDNCNSLQQFERCYICDSANDPNCVTLESPAEIRMCKNYEDTCYTHIDKKSIKRGCLMETTPQLIYYCGIYRNKCDVCTAKGENDICNRRSVAIEHCVECDDHFDKGRCGNDTEVMNEIICGTHLSSTLEGCFRQNLNGRIRRGCVHDLNYEHKVNGCLNSRSNKCKICSGRSCNKKIDFQKCIKCSSRTDPNCADVTNKLEPELCENYLDRCFVGIDKYGFTIRKCIGHDEKPKNLIVNVKPIICDENGCNGDEFPQKRLKCHKCNGDDGHCTFLPQQIANMNVTPEACDVYSKNDKCYTYLYDDSFERKMYRGCLTDSTEGRLMCQVDDRNCKICNGDACNIDPIVTPPSLSCIKCHDKKGCVYGQSGKNSQNCTMPYLFGTNETCFTREFKDGTVERGCTMDSTGGDPDWCLNADKCNECNQSGCNSENVEHQWCIRCDSRIEGEQCRNLNDIELLMNKCDSTKSSYAYDKRGCYTMKQDDFIMRGCIKDLDEKAINECKNVEWCNVCQGKHCNNERIISNSANYLASGLLVAVSVLIQSLFAGKS